MIPAWRTTKGILQKFIRELGHGNLAVFGLVVEDGDKEPTELRRIVPWTCHGVLLAGLGLLLDVTLIADLNHGLADALASFIHGNMQNLVGHGKAKKRANCLSGDDDVEDDDCFFHWAGYRVDEAWR